MPHDKILTCIQCESDFVFSFSEQQRYLRKGFDEPLRCENCRKHKTKGEIPTLPKEKTERKKKHYRIKYE